MPVKSGNFPRGSEWRQWDLHIHSPASFEWAGPRFAYGGFGSDDAAIVDQMIGTLNASVPAVFALMDYWHFDGWFALKSRLSQAGAPSLEKTVFPGIELRLAAPMKNRLNAHVIFSDDARDQTLRDFLSQLKLELTGQPLSPDGLMGYARRVGSDLLLKHGFKKVEVDADDAVALQAGYKVAELNCDSYKDAIKAVPDGQAIGFMPFNTNDGLSQIDHMSHYAYALGLFESSPIFEARDDATWNAFVGRKTEANSGWFDSFQEALGGQPRLPVSGSDAHSFLGRADDNNRRGYGDFPSGRITWIKADPTWLGLLQAIKEPEKRCYIGQQPPKLQRVAASKTFYIDRVTLKKVPDSALVEKWFDGCSIPLNQDLVAIIGNKGSGKSALADAIALLGNSQQSRYFSFLKTDRFRGKTGEPARQFSGRLDWLAGGPSEAVLAEDPTLEKVELVRYIPQGRFEVLCNEHVTGKSDAFERELRSVIFSHIAPDARIGALDFDQLTEALEKNFRTHFSEARKSLGVLNRLIVSIEDQLHPDIRKNLQEQLRLKLGQTIELEAVRPAEVAAPSEVLTEEQQTTSVKLAEVAQQQGTLSARLKVLTEEQALTAARRQAAKNVFERLRVFERQVAELRTDLQADLATSGLEFGSVISIELKHEAITVAITRYDQAGQAVAAGVASCIEQQGALKAQAQTLSDQLNEPQRAYQAYLRSVKEWQDQKDTLLGAADKPESINGLKTRLAQIEALPEKLEERRAERQSITCELYGILAEQRSARAALFQPLQKLIEENSLVRDQYRLQFQSNLSLSPDALSEYIFSIVKQNVGVLRGEDESRAAIKECCDKYELSSTDSIVGLVNDLTDVLTNAARKTTPDEHGLRSILRKDRHTAEVYDYIFGLEYIEPKYTLLFQDSPIEQLSPGQRGALLLIFYLLVDKGRNPIILDQPEENLDNETIVSLLVPVINEAKKNRQIVMVTHNPNLAVVCDAEQIIHAHFDRRANATVTYTSGAIEASSINGLVVNVLEGTKPAFDNRGGKYH